MKPLPLAEQQPDADNRLALLEARIAELERRLGVHPATIKDNKWATVKVAAFLASLTQGRIYQLADAKRIKSERFLGHLMIDLASLAVYKNRGHL